jgi:protein-L-isoaspartate O-methyltransferase
METPLMVARHLSAYVFAAPYMRGRKVLDIACGEGYGSRYLRILPGWTAVDYEGSVIEHAARGTPKRTFLPPA